MLARFAVGWIVCTVSHGFDSPGWITCLGPRTAARVGTEAGAADRRRFLNLTSTEDSGNHPFRMPEPPGLWAVLSIVEPGRAVSIPDELRQLVETGHRIVNGLRRCATVREAITIFTIFTLIPSGRLPGTTYGCWNIDLGKVSQVPRNCARAEREFCFLPSIESCCYRYPDVIDTKL